MFDVSGLLTVGINVVDATSYEIIVGWYFVHS